MCIRDRLSGVCYRPTYTLMVPMGGPDGLGDLLPEDGDLDGLVSDLDEELSPAGLGNLDGLGGEHGDLVIVTLGTDLSGNDDSGILGDVEGGCLHGDDGSGGEEGGDCLLYTSPSPRDRTRSRMPSSA
eukprot:TRINITY_DN27409_c0_g1_i1.p1 TRINITY_DN27409_c0_g1~~TRINITY_DN27409_c0_g1_i1.p1  ORF type:complete len:128 (+),score=46.85 TRINITY_DN27409_c0_g1_i1:67-450(+)